MIGVELHKEMATKMQPDRLRPTITTVGTMRYFRIVHEEYAIGVQSVFAQVEGETWIYVGVSLLPPHENAFTHINADAAQWLSEALAAASRWDGTL